MASDFRRPSRYDAELCQIFVHLSTAILCTFPLHTFSRMVVLPAFALPMIRIRKRSAPSRTWRALDSVDVGGDHVEGGDNVFEYDGDGVSGVFSISGVSRGEKYTRFPGIVTLRFEWKRQGKIYHSELHLQIHGCSREEDQRSSIAP